MTDSSDTDDSNCSAKQLSRATQKARKKLVEIYEVDRDAFLKVQHTNNLYTAGLQAAEKESRKLEREIGEMVEVLLKIRPEFWRM